MLKLSISILIIFGVSHFTFAAECYDWTSRVGNNTWDHAFCFDFDKSPCEVTKTDGPQEDVFVQECNAFGSGYLVSAVSVRPGGYWWTWSVVINSSESLGGGFFSDSNGTQGTVELVVQ